MLQDASVMSLGPRQGESGRVTEKFTTKGPKPLYISCQEPAFDVSIFCFGNKPYLQVPYMYPLQSECSTDAERGVAFCG